MLPSRLLRTGITIFALVLAVAHALLPDIKIDVITLVLLVAATLPWLQPILKSIELPGGIKLELQELRQEVKDAAGAAQSAERKADFAVASSSAPVHASLQQASDPQAQLDLLAREYVTIRKTQPSGNARTQAMTEVTRKMIELAPSLGNIDVLPLLQSEDGGRRLAGYARLYAQPNPAHLAALVASVTSLEDKPFGQYWGIQAIGRTIAGQTASDIPATTLLNLRSFLERLPRGTDRDYELRKILREIKRED